MTSVKNARTAFLVAVVLMVLSGLAAYFSIHRLVLSEAWVTHTRKVQAAIGTVEASIEVASRNRNAYILTGNDNLREAFNEAVPQIAQSLQEACGLVQDNPEQAKTCQLYTDTNEKRIGIWQRTVELRRSQPSDNAGQAILAMQSLQLGGETSVIAAQMQSRESALLIRRKRTSRRLFAWTISILCSAFVLSIWLFSIHYRLLTVELEARVEAEQTTSDSVKSLRLLTTRLLQIQDEERRKFSRELHDSLGQLLVGAKMQLDIMARSSPSAGLNEAIQSLDQAITETRTISHLLHPPLLDEVGLSSAVRWYVEQFARRSGLDIQLNLPENPPRLPRPMELALFRVLQESFTNIHRHAMASRAELTLLYLPDRVSLSVRDNGKGTPPGLVAGFQSKGTNVGVGLAGMRERARELGGQLEIISGSRGTTISVAFPFQDGDLASVRAAS